MAQEPPTTAYVEAQIDEDSISLTLISESGSSGAVIEDTERYTFEELQDMAGQHFNLSLSGDSQEALVEGRRLANIGRIFESQPRIEEGDVLIDDNPAPWSDDDRVVVEQVTNITAKDYDLLGSTTVASANPSYPEDDRVVEGHYEGSTKTYAFPESRLVQDS